MMVELLLETYIRYEACRHPSMTIEVQRVYGKHAIRRGKRFLVDRLWPRGVRKADLPIDGWLKDVAPSDSLRRWFGHDPDRWGEFVRRYGKELDRHPEAWIPLDKAAKRGRLILLFAAKDEEHNNAVALRDYLERNMRTKRPL
jgi:uncharacterized protein YeaO (DUF488 family)